MQKLPKNRVPVSIGVPFDLLFKIDEIASNEQISRSELIVKILQEKLKES